MAQYIWGDTPQPLPLLDFVTEDVSWTKLLPPGSEIVYNKGHGSSLWSQAAKISVRLQDGNIKSYFIKLTETYIGKLMAEGEYLSSVKLHEYAPDFTPAPLGWGTFTNEPDLAFFICDFIDIMDEVFPEPDEFCPRLAAMHKRSQEDPKNPGMFGWDHITCNATIVQQNKWSVSWEAFFDDKIRDIFKREEQVHGHNEELADLKAQTLDKIVPRLLRPLETGGNTLIPVFLHGDVYHLNAAAQAKPGCPSIIFDPGSYWAHNEYELISWNAPRHLFKRPHVEAYRRHFPPSEPVKEVDDRLELYTITIELISSTLYPKSTRYRQFAIDRMKKLLAKYPDGYTGDCKRKDKDEAQVVNDCDSVMN